jgi:hypothetical protein
MFGKDITRLRVFTFEGKAAEIIILMNFCLFITESLVQFYTINILLNTLYKPPNFIKVSNVENQILNSGPLVVVLD